MVVSSVEEDPLLMYICRAHFKLNTKIQRFTVTGDYGANENITVNTIFHFC